MSIHEECGVFGVYSPTQADVAGLVYYGLYALQHRGQEGCGIAVNDDGVFSCHKGLGLVSEVFNQEELAKLPQGRLAVGTVILNRVADPQFPNTVEEVIFEPGQFSPVSNGTIYREPDEDSLVAARLCLDGVREAGDCLYFNVTSLYSWADRARTYYCTIGGHNFYL